MTDQLAARLDRLEAIEAIQRLKHDYFYYCDNKQPNKVLECFMAGDIVIDYGQVGVFNTREALVEVFTQIACGEYADNMIELHHAQNPRIDIIDGSNAKGTWGIFYFLINTAENTITQLGGFYHDEYKKIDGKWLISATTFTATSTLVTDFSEGMLKKVMAVGVAKAS